MSTTSTAAAAAARTPAGFRSPALAWGTRLAFIAALLLVWHLASLTPRMRTALPGPGETVAALVEQVTQPDLWVDVWLTVQSALVGLAISVVGGVALGLVIGMSRFLTASTSFLTDFLRTVPGLALIPLGILIFGPKMSLDVFLIVFAAIWPVMIASISAVRNVDPAIREMADVYRVPTWRKYVQVLFPACLPAIGAGIRIAAVLSLLIAVGTQLLVGSPGLGSRITLFQLNAQYPQMYACVLITAVLGVVFTAVVRRAERSSLRWFYVPREMEKRNA